MKKENYLQNLFFLFIMFLGVCIMQACGEDDEPMKISTGVDVNGHIAVDLGLSVKWASCNVGADSPEEYGGYYAWGETTTKNEYYKYTYKYEGVNIGNNIAGTKYDVAHVSWGSNWRMPTYDEMNELCTKCEWKRFEYKGIKGQLVTGPNGNSIFLPTGGWYLGDSISGESVNGNYWASNLSKTYDAYSMVFSKWDAGEMMAGSKHLGHSVRPVLDK